LDAFSLVLPFIDICFVISCVLEGPSNYGIQTETHSSPKTRCGDCFVLFRALQLFWLSRASVKCRVDIEFDVFLFLFPLLSNPAAGGNTSADNNAKHDGGDGTSFISPDGETFLDPLKGTAKKTLVCVSLIVF